MARQKMEPISRADVKTLLQPAAEQLPATSRHIEVLAPQHEPRTTDDFAEAITTEWEGAQERFLRIGALLIRAQADLSDADYLALAERLPFGKAVRSQIMTAYKAINSGLVPKAVAPAGYTTVYALATLTPDERQQAANAGLLRPDVKQAEVRAFTSAIRPPKEKDRTAKLAERARLLKRLDELNRELGLVDQTKDGQGA